MANNLLTILKIPVNVALKKQNDDAGTQSYSLAIDS